MLLRALMNGSMLSGSSGGSLAPRALRRLATVLTGVVGVTGCAAGYRVGGGVSVAAAAAAVAPPCVRADVRPIRRVSVVGDVRFYSVL